MSINPQSESFVNNMLITCHQSDALWTSLFVLLREPKKVKKMRGRNENQFISLILLLLSYIIDHIVDDWIELVVTWMSLCKRTQFFGTIEVITVDCYFKARCQCV